jgi:hypothetical protein
MGVGWRERQLGLSVAQQIDLAAQQCDMPGAEVNFLKGMMAPEGRRLYMEEACQHPLEKKAEQLLFKLWHHLPQPPCLPDMLEMLKKIEGHVRQPSREGPAAATASSAPATAAWRQICRSTRTT